jgi:RNA recognition motif-containing protein
MSDAHAAPVSENGVPVAHERVEEAPGFKVFAGNLAYTTTDEGLKAFFAPVASDILSAQVIMRGLRSSGYGFVALATEEAALKAVETLDKKELDGRSVIVEIAKPSDQKDKEKRGKKIQEETRKAWWQGRPRRSNRSRGRWRTLQGGRRRYRP